MSQFTELTTKKARVAHIRSKLNNDKEWALKGLMRIYSHQTADEQATHTTRVHNNVGFTGADAEILSSFAEQVNRKRVLSVKQMAIVFKMMPKYAGQLEKVSKSGESR